MCINLIFNSNLPLHDGPGMKNKICFLLPLLKRKLSIISLLSAKGMTWVESRSNDSLIPFSFITINKL